MFTAKDALYQSMAYTDKKTNDIQKTSTRITNETLHKIR